MAFLGKFCPKCQNCHFMRKYRTYTNSCMESSMMLFSFFVFEWKYSFWANLVQKIKIVTLCWNLIPRLIRICRIQWCHSLFLFSSANGLFGQILPKMSKLSLYAEIWYLHWFLHAAFNSDVHTFCLVLGIVFWQIWSKKSKLSVEVKIW